MADEQGIDTAANGEDTSPQVGLIAQYVKDLSFENPTRRPSISGKASRGSTCSSTSARSRWRKMSTRWR